jgi:hypothetical protein
MTRMLTVYLALCAVLLGHVGAFLLPAVAPVGLRKRDAGGRGRPAQRGALRMTGDDFDFEEDFVFARVFARMQFEPVQLSLAYMEHAFASESATIPADLLEAAFAASPGDSPDDVPQKRDEPSEPKEPIAPPTLPPIGANELRATPVEARSDPEQEAEADVKHGIVPFASKVPEEQEGKEDVASVLARVNMMGRSCSVTPNSKDVRGNPFFHVKNNVAPFDSSSMAGGQSEDAASILERTNSMLANSNPVEPDKNAKKWAREHTLLTACNWERRMVTEAIIQDLTPYHGGNSTLSQPE